MAITTLPTFEDDEILSAGKLNELVNAVETKFSGAISGADISWPLIAQGNLDMNGYSILGVKTFWNIINAAEYSTLQAAIDAAEAAGGGAVTIPPNTTIEAQGLTVTAGSIAFIGYGASSKIKLPDAPTSDMFTTSASIEDITFTDLYFDGNTGAGTSINCLTLTNLIDGKVRGCEFDDFSGVCISLKDDLGAACQDIEITGCVFKDGDGNMIQAEGLVRCEIVDCDMESATALAGIIITPSTSAQAEAITITANHITVPGPGIRMVSNGGSDYGDNIILGNYVRTTGTTKSGIIIGEAGTPMQNCVIADNIVEMATGNGFEVVGPGMALTANIARNCSVDGFVVASDDLTMQGNIAKANGGDGIKIENCSEIAVSGNFSVDNGDDGYHFSNIDFGYFTGNGAHNNTGGVLNGVSGMTNCVTAGNAFGGLSNTSLYSSSFALGGALSIGAGVDIIGANNGSNVSDAFNTSADAGSPLIHRERAQVLQTDSSPSTIWTVPSGAIWIIHRAYVRTVTAWDGSGTDLDIGISGGDVDGLIDGSTITGFPETVAIKGQDPADRGSLLYSSREISYAVDASGGAVNIIATITAGGGTTGVSDIYIEYSVLKDQDGS
jgi:hypothetical protein